MTILVPPAAVSYDSKDNLLGWLENNRKQSGDLYQASVYGGTVYVISAPQYAEHVLRRNWQNYKKGLAIERVAMLLGRGLMVSEAELWKKQRRMIQPAFHHNVITRMLNIIIDANGSLLRNWERAARKAESVNVTLDTSLTILEIVLRTIFGDDYQQVAPRFSILSDEPARNLEFARAFRALGSLITQVAAYRRKHHIVSPDMLGMLMEPRDKDSGQCMSDGQLVAEILTLIVAGHETTAGTLNWT